MQSHFLGAVLRATLVVALAALPFAGSAGSFQVNPVRIDLRDGATSGAIVVRNDGPEPVAIQTSILAWSQADGQDAYTATREALATPPIATIAPGGEQILRVGLRRPPDAMRELAYRLFVQEVPGPPQPGFQGLQVALRVGLPVFVAPLVPVRHDLDWSAARLADGRLRVALRNRGNVHVQIYDFVLRANSNAEPDAREPQIAYVLAGETREWVLSPARPLPASAATLRLTAFTDAGEIDTPVRLDP